MRTTTTAYLSVVATSRNDDHGGDPLIRTQIFINSLARQCERYKLPAELIIVDWNPVADRPGLAAVLKLPEDCTYLTSRVITVPSVLHYRIKYSEKLPLFQMIAKNVGIRRAQGKFILATNIDIIFSDELMKYIANQDLDASKQYRVDRYDIHSGLSKDLSLEQTLDYAWNNPIRTNRRSQPENLVKQLYGDELFRRVCVPDETIRAWSEHVNLVHHNDIWQIHPQRDVDMSFLHTNACGDFTLLSKEGWEAIRGYPEFAAYSFNIDSIGMIAAHYSGFKEIALLPPCVCFHIEHGAGSGWTPEWESKLFNRLRQAEILNPEWPVLTPLVHEMREKAKTLEFNHAGWGLAEFELPEQPMGDTKSISPAQLDHLRIKAEKAEVAAIQPGYDLDRLTLAHERREYTKLLSKIGLTTQDKLERPQIYIPDANGNYYEENSVTCKALFPYTSKVEFTIENYPCNFPLRFDPCESFGYIDIYSISAVDLGGNRVIWKLDANTIRQLPITGTAKLFMENQVPMMDVTNRIAVKKMRPEINSVSQIKNFVKSCAKRIIKRTELTAINESVRIVSLGSDPQILLPPIAENIVFPLSISIEMSFTPIR